MDRRFLTVLAVSLLFALVISGVFYQVVAGSTRGGPRKPPKVEKRDMVVASHPLSVGSVLSADDVKLTQTPVEEFPAGCFSRAEEVIGRPVASNILADEPIRDGRLAQRGSGLGLAPAIPNGMRAVSVKVNDVVGVAGFVLPGMRVDVLATGRPPDGDNSSSITKTVLQDILVLSAGQTIEPSANGHAINAPVVTLLVTPQQAETLTLAGEWRIQLVLRNGSDRTIENVPGRALWELSGVARKSPEAAALAPSPKRVAVVAPVSVQRAPEEVVVFRGTQRTVEQVGVRNP
jgi:pilus assembly protein CpaB